MEQKDLEEEKELLQALRNKDEKALKQLRRLYREHLIIYTFCKLNDMYLSTKIVDELFERLWSDSFFDHVEPPIYNFLRDEIKRICSY